MGLYCTAHFTIEVVLLLVELQYGFNLTKLFCFRWVCWWWCWWWWVLWEAAGLSRGVAALSSRTWSRTSLIRAGHLHHHASITEASTDLVAKLTWSDVLMQPVYNQAFPLPSHPAISHNYDTNFNTTLGKKITNIWAYRTVYKHIELCIMFNITKLKMSCIHNCNTWSTKV